MRLWRTEGRVLHPDYWKAAVVGMSIIVAGGRKPKKVVE